MADKNIEKDKSKEIDIEELSNVTGGSGMRKTKKETTHDISDDTKSKIIGNNGN